MIQKIFKSVFWRQIKPDLYILSYPKTGRTWLRSLIGKYLSEKYGISERKMLRTKYITSASGLLTSEFIHDGSAMVKSLSYSELPTVKTEYKNKKVLLMGRNVKDTLVSAYFQATKRVNLYDKSISDFIRDEKYGANKILRFYQIWEENSQTPEDFLFIRYEDLHSHPLSTMIKALQFMGESKVDESLLEKSIEFCSFKNLQNAEKTNKYKQDILKPSASGDPESFKVRKGKVKNYAEYLSPEDIDYVDKRIKEYNCKFCTE